MDRPRTDTGEVPIREQLIELGTADGVAPGVLQVTTAGHPGSGAPVVCAAHPSDDFAAGTAALLNEITGCDVVCVNMRGVGRSTAVEVAPENALAAMADDLEAVRRRLALPPWVFWGMSGGGWIGQHHAGRHPAGLAALVLESTCACFRIRLADPACLLSPFHPMWRPALEGHGLMAPGSHDEVGDATRTEWTEVPGVGSVFRRRQGPALLVSPAPIDARMRAVMPALWCFDARPWLSSLRLPTLVLAGNADPVVPLAHARSLQHAIPGAELVEIEGAGHVPSADRHPKVRESFERFWRYRVDSQTLDT